MCIKSSVGEKGINQRSDVLIVQILINMNIFKIITLRLLSVDGKIGANTKGAIKEFQERVVKLTRPDGRVDPGGRTLSALQSGIPAGFSKEKLRGIMPRATSKNIATYFPHLVISMKKRGITTPLRQAHFLAQIAHESASFRYTEEIASGAAYEGRKDLGNTESGDGTRFKGRGLIQLTGRTNYKSYGKSIGADLLSGKAHLTIASDPARAVDVACWFWEAKNLNKLADADDVRAVTRRINGGYNGLEDRKRYLKRAKFFLVK